jgi:Alcohol dehydrogenase GroES-like domain
VRAVVLLEFGSPEALVAAEVPDPVPGQGQVLIEVEIANITFVETQVRAGRAPNPAMAPRLPAILGNGVGGVVASVGAGVDPSLVSRRVVTSTGGSGGYAERVAVEAAGLIAVPDELGLAEAVALLADGRTAGAGGGRARRHRVQGHRRQDPAHRGRPRGSAPVSRRGSRAAAAGSAAGWRRRSGTPLQRLPDLGEDRGHAPANRSRLGAGVPGRLHRC